MTKKYSVALLTSPSIPCEPFPGEEIIESYRDMLHYALRRAKVENYEIEFSQEYIDEKLLEDGSVQKAGYAWLILASGETREAKV